MNERIRKLAEQAKKYALDEMIKITDRDKALKIYSDCYETKFAELLIMECLTICEELGDKGMDGHYCADEIVKHFGVKL